MSVQLAKWGNALGVRIPAFLARKANLNPGDLVDFELLETGEIVLKPVASESSRLKNGWRGSAARTVTMKPTGAIPKDTRHGKTRLLSGSGRLDLAAF